MTTTAAYFQKAREILPGKEREVKLALTGLLSQGHVLIEDVPGMGKTTLVGFIAKSFALELKRIQFTNDLLPSDILGVSILRPENHHFFFRPGPIFGDMVLADELNRAPPKTQSALLQAMEERQVTVDGETHALPEVFSVIATQNPRGQMGTFPLPESQLDRFMMKFAMGYPDQDAELELLRSSSKRLAIDSMTPIYDKHLLREWQLSTAKVTVSDELLKYIQRLLQASRQSMASHGLSPRAGLDLVKAAKAWAWLASRQHVIPDDIHEIFAAVCGHRLVPRERQSVPEETRAALELLKKVQLYI